MNAIIAPCLWFDGQAEEAARFYVSIFPDSRVDHVDRSAADWPAGKAGDVVMVHFTLSGQRYQALNGGPFAAFNEAVSLAIDCADQGEVDRYWNALLDGGGEPIMAGWLKDRYGLRWQVVPRRLTDMLRDPDRERARRATEAMHGMTKLDIAALEAAYEGPGG